MSAVLKIQLKSAREAIERKAYQKAKDFSLSALECDDKNYNAWVFLGLAEQHLENYNESEKAYFKALQQNDVHPLAIQGLCSLYEKVEKISEYMATVDKLLGLFRNDVKKCLETVLKMVSFVETKCTDSHKVQGKRLYIEQEIIEAYSYLMEKSPVYSIIKDSPDFPPISSTLQKLIVIQEQQDAQYYDKEVEARRTRLGADTLENIKIAVDKEIVSRSQLGHYYESLLQMNVLSAGQVLDTKSKLLIFLFKKTIYGTDQEKAKYSGHVLSLSKELIDNQVKSELAFEVQIEYSNMDVLEDEKLPSFGKLLSPEHPLAQCACIFFDWKSHLDATCLVEQLIQMTEKNSNFILPFHLLGLIYFGSQEYESCCVSLKKALENVSVNEQKIGMPLPNKRQSLDLLYAESKFQLELKTSGRKTYDESLGIYKNILQKDATHIRALKGLSAILMEMKKYEEAVRCLEKVVQLASKDQSVLIDLAWAHYCRGQVEKSISMFKESSQSSDLSPLLHSLCYYRLGRILWDQNEENRRDKALCFQYFVESAKKDQNNALAFCYLGHYYLEIEKDTPRAIKCYYKCHSLIMEKSATCHVPEAEDPSPKLGQLYVESKNMDSASQVVKNMCENNPKNAWAWKTLGVLRMNMNNYAEAITQLQASLRLNVSDPCTWECLADSYVKEGKYMAALKAFGRSIELEEKSALKEGREPMTAYSAMRVADIHRKLGQFEEAMTKYQDLIKDERIEWMVARKLADTCLLLARELISDGAFGRGCLVVANGIQAALQGLTWALKHRDSRSIKGAQGVFKTLGDLCCQIRSVSGYTHLLNRSLFDQVIKKCTDFGVKVEQASSLDDIDHSLLAASCAYLAALHTQSHAHLAADYLHDLSLVYYWRYRYSMQSHVQDKQRTEGLLVLSTKYLKMALKTNPKNADYWNTLGTITFEQNPALSQHAFIRSLEFNSKNVGPWINLGLLYLIHKDFDLADQAFNSALYVDPECPMAWFGQAWIKWQKGTDKSVLFELLEHTLDVGGSSMADINLSYAYYHYLTHTTQSDPTVFNTPIFSLYKYVDRVFPQSCPNQPNKALSNELVTALNLLGLFLERQGNFKEAVVSLKRALDVADYLGSDNLMSLRENYARCLCSLGEFEESISHYNQLNESADTFYKIGQGLALYFSRKIAESFAAFEGGLQSDLVKDQGPVQDQVSVMVAQVLYALGTDQHTLLAKKQLLDSIQQNRHNLRALFALCTLGLIKNDLELTEKASLELVLVPPDVLDKAGLDGDLEWVLSHAYMIQSKLKKAGGFLARAIHQQPWIAKRWSRLAKYLYQSQPCKCPSAAKVASAATHISKRENISKDIFSEIWCTFGVSLLSNGNAGCSKSIRVLQKAIKLDPSNMDAWLALAMSLRSRMAALMVKPHDFLGVNTQFVPKMIEKGMHLRNLLRYLAQKPEANISETKEQLSQHVHHIRILKWTHLLYSDCGVYLAHLLESPQEQLELIRESYTTADEILKHSEEGPLSALAHVVMARCLRFSGDVALALESYKRATVEMPNSAAIWEELAEFYLLQRLPLAAELCLNEAISQSEASSKLPGCMRLASLALSTGNYAQASDAISNSQAVAASVYPRLLQGILQLKSSSSAKASKTLSSLLETHPDQIWLNWAMAKVHQAKNEEQDAKACFDKEKISQFYSIF